MLKYSDCYTPDETIGDMVSGILGDDYWQRLVKSCGGLELKVPGLKWLTDNHILVRRMGREDAELLCRELSGMYLDIPKCPNRKAAKQQRAQLIRQRIGEGLTRVNIAGELGISSRHLRRLITSLGLTHVTFVNQNASLAPFEAKAQRRIIDELIAGKISLGKAALELELSQAAIAKLLQQYIKLGNTQPKTPSIKPQTGNYRDSNGGLTGVAGLARYQLPKNYECPPTGFQANFSKRKNEHECVEYQSGPRGRSHTYNCCPRIQTS